MKTVDYLVFRYLTHADFFNIYKPLGTEEGGGGQSYIDFKVGSVPLDFWREFFSDAADVDEGVSTQGPSWKFPINSIGLDISQQLKMYQRRPQSIIIAAQRLDTSESNRVPAWLPENGFPQPEDRENRRSCPPGLAIYLVRTEDDEFWAGWFQGTAPVRNNETSEFLRDLLPEEIPDGHAGYFHFPTRALFINELDAVTPFIYQPTPGAIPPSTRRSRRLTRSEDEVIDSLFNEDETYASDTGDQPKKSIREVRARNTKAVKELKELYGGQCQISGEKYSFVKENGVLYSEAHHLIQLGDDGADSPHNIIIVSPLIHRMLHYAKVGPIDLSTITPKDTLEIVINDETYTITWHPEHANYVRRHQNDES